jgi:hypothetical protein
MPRVNGGRARYRSVERSGPAKTGEVVYHEYALGGRRVAFECRTDQGVWEVSDGRVIDPAAIEVLG